MKKIVSLIAVSSILVNASATTTSAVYAEESKSNLNSKLSKNREEQEELGEKIKKLDSQIKEIESNIKSTEEKIAKLNSETEEAKKEIQDLLNKIKDNEEALGQRLKVIDNNYSMGYIKVILSSTSLSDFFNNLYMVKEVIEQDRDLLKELEENKAIVEEKKKSLEAKMLQSLSILMHKKNFIQRVDVDINATGDDIDIVLYSKSDKVIDKSSLSMGERQMYASALLSSLVDESEIEFPVFIDSPMQKFDEQHAENIIRYFYPNVSKQVVIFPLINKELTEKEYSILLPKICRAYLIDNISTDSSEFVEAPSDKFIEKYNQKYNAD